MKKSFIYLVILASVFFTSCSPLAIVPTAVNTVNSVRLSELNLEREDYKILNTITAEASVVYSRFGKTVTIEDENGDFSITFKRIFSISREGIISFWQCKSFKGVARYGFLANDYGTINSYLEDIDPEDIARHIAIYRLINACKVAGGDGVIEPVVSTNVGQQRRDIVFKTTVTAKVIKINVDK